jgi:hypothetical protein
MAQTMARAHRLIAALLVLQGAGHTFVGGPMFFDSITQAAVWYLCAGLAIMLLGAMNVVMYQPLASWVRWLVVAGNLLFLLLTLGLLTTSQSWRVQLVVALAAGCLLGSLLSATGRSRSAVRQS